jgi:protein O-mannosyl-transferase
MPRPSHIHYAAAAAVVILGFLAYANTLKGEFVWDDASSILLHEDVQDPSKVLDLFKKDQHAFAGGQGNFYRPMLSLTFMTDFWLAWNGPPVTESRDVVTQLNPFLFHLSSISWHIAAALFLLYLLSRLNAPTAVVAIVPIIYVLHPLHTEAVAYISGRADSMSAAFMFAGLSFATWQETSRRRLAGVGLSSFMFVGALLSKESAFIYPVLLAMILFYQDKMRVQDNDNTAPPLSLPRRYMSLITAAALFAGYAALRLGPLNFGTETQPVASTFFGRLTETFQSFALYLGLLFFPTGLHMERTLDGIPSWIGIVGALLLLACGVFIYRQVRGKNYRAALGMMWFIVTWLPISGLFPLNAPMAEHWLYVPMAGFFWALAEWIAFDSPRQPVSLSLRRFAAVGGILLTAWIAMLLFRTVDRNRDWHDNISLYEATLRENPSSPRVQYNLAVTWQDLENNPIGAKRHFRNVVALYADRKSNNPDEETKFWNEEIDAYFSLGNIYLSEGNYGEAFNSYSVLYTLVPNDSNRQKISQAVYGMGECLRATGDAENAQTYFERASEILQSDQ